MSRVLSHIIQKRFSKVNEDVATDALAYILDSSSAANNGMRKLLRGLIPDLPALSFRTQEAEGSIRPDMWGYDGPELRVFLENKFWAGLTDNQPVNYLKELAKCSKQSALLVVAPHTRRHTLWAELQRRMNDAGITCEDNGDSAGIEYSASTSMGPMVALTSWDNILSLLEHESADDIEARGDLVQLRSLCDAADIDAFSPLSREEITDQRIPALVLELSSICEDVSNLGISEGVIDHKGTRPQASSERIGRYTYMTTEGEVDKRAGAWMGIHFRLWKKHGVTPLWAVFHNTEWGQAQIMRDYLEPWATKKGIFTTTESDGSFAVALDLPHAEEKDAVVRAIVDKLGSMRREWLRHLPNNTDISTAKS